MSVLEAAIGIIAPPECIGCNKEGSAICDSCAAALIPVFGERCWRCNALSRGCRTCDSCRHTSSPSHVYIVTDYDETARDLLRLYKFGHQRTAAQPIARMMTATFRRHADNRSGYLMVPVPTATSRMRERGFGHSELLAKKVAADLRTERAQTLQRHGQIRQLGARREDRLKQLRGSFTVRNPRTIHGRKVLLIDDVVTTGGTLIAAAESLRAAGAKQVDALLFAKRL